MNPSPVELYILLHLKRAGVEYAKMIMKLTELPLDEIQNAIAGLLERGLIKRDSGSAIKRTRARFKLASEVHKHHTYYHLSREGVLYVRKIDGEFMQDYFNSLLGPGGFECVKTLHRAHSFKDACQNNNACEKFRDTLIKYRMLTESGKKTRFFDMFADFAGL
ncbi:MAG: DUF2250 domain-containing protein [Euryarchaeota archaeon]|nr:DUF2250 domain-containing protein [Euryarchaeota archaeon]